jgi:hypothetical protein
MSGKKREASASPNAHRQRKKQGFQCSAGDWKCGRCGWWNKRIWIACKYSHRRGGESCGAARDDDTIKHHVQAEEEGVFIEESNAECYGDWRCGDCKAWNRGFRTNCHRCNKEGSESKDADDFSQKLDLPYYYYVDSSKDYWTGGVERQGDSHADHAAYLGVKGRFKEKKNPYKPRD